MTELTDEEKKFWLCNNCENEAINCECGDKQDIFEIPILAEKIFGVTSHPALVKYDPMIKKVLVKTPYVELEEDYELLKLKDLGFVICTIKASRNDDTVFHLRRIR